MIKVVTIVGARPQFIKAAAVSREFIKSGKIKEVIVHTGQHYDSNMSDIFFEEMEIPKPDYFLGINGLSHGAMTGQMLEKIEEVLLNEHPDWVLVYGDTNSTLAGALAAKKLHLKVAHVEAGLRSFNMKMPEEINRILTDRISDILFCPTDTAVENLETEGFTFHDIKIFQNGDVMQDAAIFYSSKCRKPKFDLPETYVLATIHRAENTDSIENLTSIFKAFHEIGKTKKIVLPIHPRTRKILDNSSIEIDNQKIILIDPVGYLEMVYLLKNCELVMTDSGGLQKEAFFFEKNCVTFREETEWVELVKNGFNIVSGTDSKSIIEGYKKQKSIKSDFNIDLYGKGMACRKIVDALLNY